MSRILPTISRALAGSTDAAARPYLEPWEGANPPRPIEASAAADLFQDVCALLAVTGFIVVVGLYCAALS